MADLHHVLQILADISGWIYFASWTASFYPQTIMNFRNKNVAGYSLDFVMLNALGYVSYTIYTCTLYWNKEIKLEYVNYEHTKHKDVPVVANDVAFAVHGLILTMVWIYQCIFYDRGIQKFSYISLLIVTCGSLLLLALMVACLSSALEWYWLINVAGYVKMSISFIKSLPQLYLNYKRKSTKGFIMLGVLGDLVGGAFSVLQQIIYSVMNNDDKEITGNIPKLILGWESMIFDAVFFWQHYVFYFKNKPIEEIERSLKTVPGESNLSVSCSDDFVINKPNKR